MQKKIISILLFIFINTFNAIDIQLGQQKDLAAIMQLNEFAFSNYFKPLAEEYTDNQALLDILYSQKLITEHELFQNGINNINDTKILVAYYNEILVGFIACRQVNTTLNIDILIVHPQCIKKGIGKSLVNSARQNFSNIDLIFTAVLNNNISMLKFCASMGFKEISNHSFITDPMLLAVSHIFTSYGLKSE